MTNPQRIITRHCCSLQLCVALKRLSAHCFGFQARNSQRSHQPLFLQQQAAAFSEEALSDSPVNIVEYLAANRAKRSVNTGLTFTRQPKTRFQINDNVICVCLMCK